MKKTIRDFTKIFRSETSGFLSRLNLTKEERAILLAAKQDVRDVLRSGLRAFGKRKGIIVEPKFLSQGSAVYKTQNRPSHSPPQQVDHDFGCYLPFSYLENNGSPKIAALEFFTEVDILLEQLAERKKYQGVDKNKKTCSRLVINDHLHIDVPLYSVPDHEMQTITEAMIKLGFKKDSLEFGAQYFNPDFIGPVFTSDQVYLAHRLEGWKKSDPRKLNNHYNKLFKSDEMLRRICRYLKAFRDEKWTEGGPSSISLMILAENAKRFLPPEIEMEQEVFHFILKEFPSLLEKEILNPTDSSEKISVSGNDRKKLSGLCRGFASDLEIAVNSNELSDIESCRLIQSNLGSRFPKCSEIPKKQNGKNETDEDWKKVAIKNLAAASTVRPKPYFNE